MAWEILAIWAIVVATIAWFMRDERRLIAPASTAQAASFKVPAARRIPAPPEDETDIATGDPAGPRVPPRAELNSVERQFLRLLSENA